MTTYRAFALLGFLLLLAVALAYVCANGLPGDPTLIEQQIRDTPNELPPERKVEPQPEPPVAPDEPTPVDVPPVEPPAASPSQAAPNCEGGQCEVRSVPRQSSRRRGFFQRMFGR